MSLHTSLADRLRPWHGLMLAVFVVGAALSAVRNDLLTPGIGLGALFRPVLEGLVAVVVFQFTVGNVWAYAVEYRNAGGQWRDGVFLAPVVVSVLAAVAVLAAGQGLGAAVWVAFWIFVVVAAVLALAVQVVVGYREAGGERAA